MEEKKNKIDDRLNAPWYIQTIEILNSLSIPANDYLEELIFNKYEKKVNMAVKNIVLDELIIALKIHLERAFLVSDRLRLIKSFEVICDGEVTLLSVYDV